MINFSKQSLSQRRQRLLRSLQQQQHQQIKSKHRYQFECQVTNPVAEVWRLKHALAQYNIHYYSKEILEIVNSIRPYLTDLMFLRELKSARLLQDLLALVLGQLRAKSYLQAPLLAEMMVQLSAEVLKGTELFLRVVQDHVGWLLFAVQKYPLNNRIVQKVTNCLAALHPIHHLAGSKHGLISPQQQQLVVSKMMEIYLVRDGYQTSCGMLEFVEPSQKGDQRWFRNAVNAMEIVGCLLPILQQNEYLSPCDNLKQGLIEGLRAFINKKRQVHPSIQQQSTQPQTPTEYHPHNYFDRQFEECITYFITILLDIFMLRQQLIDEQEQSLLKQVLSILLWQAKKGTNVVNAAKIIKILYEQVVLDEGDLLEISNRYEELYGFIQNIISNDCV